MIPGHSGGHVRGKLLFGLFVLTLISMFGAMKYRRSLDIEDAKIKHATRAHSPADASTKPVAEAAATSEAPLPVAAPSIAAPSDPQFQRWIQEEAKSLDSLNVNGDEKQAQIRRVVSKITPGQAAQLRQTVMHPQAKTREKILSAYILVEGGLNTREELQKAISAHLTQKGGEVHSEDEMNGVREKSLRIMMIDGLFAQAQSDIKARESLAKAIVDSEDPYIKAYAQEKYDQLPKR